MLDYNHDIDNCHECGCDYDAFGGTSNQYGKFCSRTCADFAVEAAEYDNSLEERYDTESLSDHPLYLHMQGGEY